MKTHVSHILQKLHLEDRTQIAVYAHRHRLVEWDVKLVSKIKKEKNRACWWKALFFLCKETKIKKVYRFNVLWKVVTNEGLGKISLERADSVPLFLWAFS